MEQDELRAIQSLADLGSQSAALTIRLGLTRSIIKEVYKQLEQDRQAQVNLTEILSAARFRYAFEGNFLPVRCPRCKIARDCFDHMTQCYPLKQKEAHDEAAIEFLAELATKTKTSPVGLKYPIFQTS